MIVFFFHSETGEEKCEAAEGRGHRISTPQTCGVNTSLGFFFNIRTKIRYFRLDPVGFFGCEASKTLQMLGLPFEEATPGCSGDLRVAGSEVTGAGGGCSRWKAGQGAYPSRANKGPACR